MRLIDADAFKEWADKYYDCTDLGEIVRSWIDERPTIDAEPVKRGRWLYRDTPLFGNPYGSYECSECGNSVPHKTWYCPWCGAKMEV